MTITLPHCIDGHQPPILMNWLIHQHHMSLTYWARYWKTIARLHVLDQVTWNMTCRFGLYDNVGACYVTCLLHLPVLLVVYPCGAVPDGRLRWCFKAASTGMHGTVFSRLAWRWATVSLALRTILYSKTSLKNTVARSSRLLEEITFLFIVL